MSDHDDELEDNSEGASNDPNVSKTIRVRAIVAEINFLKETFGDMSKFTREAIRNELERRGIEIPEGFFFERPPGNWTKGDLRRGKENRRDNYNPTAA